MSSFFRGAINLLQGDIGGVTSSHPLVGQDVDVGGIKVRIRSLLAEGGFAIVFTAEDQKGQYYALKRQNASDRDAVKAIEHEIAVLKELSGGPSIIKFYKSSFNATNNGYSILTELCTGGSVVDYLKEHRPKPDDVLRIFVAACKAVQHMHRRPQPITHRDIKVENLLFDSQGKVKLCDFGSATREVRYPDDSWTSLMRIQLIEEMQRNTTPMYRAPEVQDEYMNMPVGPQQDVWALGCVLFYLCYGLHPFEDSAKLRIINAKFVIPKDEVIYTMFIPLIESCLQPDPRKRVTITDLVERTCALGAAMEVDVNSAIRIAASVNTAAPSLPSDNPSAGIRSSSGRSEINEMSQQASAMLGALKGQGLSIFKNLKDKSAAVVQTVQCTYGARGPDVCWVTSRVALAPQEPVLETLASPAEDVLRTFCTEQQRPYLMTNISNRHLSCEFPTKPLEHLFPMLNTGQTPTLNILIKLCRSMIQFLRQNPNGFVVIYGSEPHGVLMAAALLLYSRLLPRPVNVLELITQKRSVNLPPSFHRLLDLLTKVVHTPKDQLRQEVHNFPVQLESLVMEPLPRVNRLRKGCRPFVEIYSAGNKLWSTCKEYDDLKSFEEPEKSAEIKIGCVPVGDDVTLVVSHARWSKMQNKMQQVWMFSAGFHANFWERTVPVVTLSRGDLDINCSESEFIPGNFRTVCRHCKLHFHCKHNTFLKAICHRRTLVAIYTSLPRDMKTLRSRYENVWKPKIVLGLKIGNQDRGFSNGVAETPVFLGYDEAFVSPSHLVSDMDESDTIKRNYDFGSSPAPPRPNPPANKAAPPPQPAPTTDFFGTLDWGQTSAAQQNSNNALPNSSVNLFDSLQPLADSQRNPSPSDSVKRPDLFKGVDTAESYERMYGIRVGKEEEDDDADKYKFDYERNAKETPIFGAPTPVQSAVRPPVQEFDLLGFGSAATAPSASTSSTNASDPFGDLLGFGGASAQPSISTHTAKSSGADLLGDWGAPTNGTLSATSMHRNVSAPAFGQPSSATSFDPFADFLSAQSMSNSNPGSKPDSGANSGTSTPHPSRPNYSRGAFDALNNPATAKPKVTADSFGDLLSSQGFNTSTAKNSNRTMGDMRRAEEIRDLTPEQIKIRDWTKGKEKNIRALLGSLSSVVWEGCTWQQPPMAEILDSSQVKKWYRKACLVVHPDKQTGKPQEELAKAIFTELNEAWTAFEQAGCPST